jgi:hypothetical protein
MRKYVTFERARATSCGNAAACTEHNGALTACRLGWREARARVVLYSLDEAVSLVRLRKLE